MGDKSIIVFDHLKSYMGYYLTIIAVLGSLWMVFVFYDKWKDERIQMHNEINILKQDQKDHRRLDSLLLEEQYKLQTKLGIVEAKTDIHSKDIKGMRSSILRYMSQDEALTKLDFIRFVQEINGDSNIINMYPYLLPKNKSKRTK